LTGSGDTDYYGVLSILTTSFMRLLPREEKFYHLFLKQVEIIAEAAHMLLEGARA